MDVLSNHKTFLTLILFVGFGLFFFSIINDSNYYTIYFTPSYLFSHQRPKQYTNLGNNTNPKAYLVDTSNCQIVKWPTFDEQTKLLYENKTLDRIKCNYGKSRGISIKRFNYTGIQVINNSDKSIECFKSEIKRKEGTDDKIHFLPSVNISTESIHYCANSTTVKITCIIDKGHKGYEKIIPLIPEVDIDSTVDNDLPNILFVGIDSVSRINFDRHFPLTTKLLSKHEFHTMYGYNKVADNTFVNLTPLLTGYYVDDLWNETISKSVFLDYFPLIWKEYNKRGHKTLLVEDYPGIATFNYLKKGFNKQPTDYYLRPFGLAIEDNVKKDCYLDKTEIETYYDYLYDFIRAMNSRQQKYFAFTFMARLTHGSLNSAGLVDPLVSSLFNRLFDENLMSNTILVFFSDHGIRFGDIRKTLSGKIEERMPFMHIYVPQEWRNHNLTINENRLTTPFDIHATLKHIIKGEPDLTLPYGKSLLDEIPENRSCQSIPILEHWCSCQSSEPISDLTKVNQISQYIVNSVNALVAEKYDEKCVELSFNKTVSAFEQHLSEKVLKFKDSKNDVIGRHVVYGKKTEESLKHFLITLEVKPSAALFEATVRLDSTSNEMQIIGEVSRINIYGNQSDCIDNQFVRRYCFCKNHLLS